MSFAIDPPLLVASGAAIESTVVDPEAADRLGAATVAAFIAFSALLYANAPGLSPIWRPFGARSGREFMLTSGLAEIAEERMAKRHHMVAIAQFALYPAWLGLGRALVRRR